MVNFNHWQTRNSRAPILKVCARNSKMGLIICTWKCWSRAPNPVFTMGPWVIHKPTVLLHLCIIFVLYKWKEQNFVICLCYSMLAEYLCV